MGLAFRWNAIWPIWAFKAHARIYKVPCGFHICTEGFSLSNSLISWSFLRLWPGLLLWPHQPRTRFNHPSNMSFCVVMNSRFRKTLWEIVGAMKAQGLASIKNSSLIHLSKVIMDRIYDCHFPFGIKADRERWGSHEGAQKNGALTGEQSGDALGRWLLYINITVKDHL